jgi:phosphatidylglycerophosphatase A
MSSGRKPKTHTRPPFFPTLVATGLYVGYTPWASGTVGTLFGVLLYLVPGFDDPFILANAIVVTFLGGVYASGKVADIVGHQLTKSAEITKKAFQSGEHETPDPSIVVIDEVVGMWIALFLLPKTPIAILLAFLAFRAFDILKPFPARHVERIPHGWGIMLDDVVAGVYANVTAVILYGVLLSLFPELS